MAPGAKLRSRVVPSTPRKERGACKKLRRTRIPWAELLRRVWAIDILHCLRCGGRREVIGLIKDPLQARKILQHLGLETETYDALPARAPPQLDLAL